MAGADAWGGLLASPLPWMAGTVGAFLLAQEINRRCGGHPLTQPVALAVALLIALLVVTGVPVQTYTGGTAPLRFLLGPATVALAVPLYTQIRAIRRAAGAMTAALLAGAVTSAVGVVVLGRVLGASEQTVLSLAPKSATTPIAMGVAERIGGLPSLTAVFVILTGIIGATLGGWALRLGGVRAARDVGFALGTAAGGIGTARAFQHSETAGAFSGLAMGLCGLATAVLVPLLSGVMW